MIQSVKSEIKSWERDFKVKHARHPTVQDIKDQPPIGIYLHLINIRNSQPSVAEKYKLYKKLSKAVAAADTPNHPSSTPPRSQNLDTRISLLLSKPRVIESTEPLLIYNPFSPIKNKGTPTGDFTGSHVFASPSKIGKNNSNLVDSKEPSPDVIPATIPFHPGALSSSYPPAEDVVSRARKRLRGEPVSPSPNKEKRRRTGSSLPFTKIGSFIMPSDDDGVGEDDEGEANSSFIDDSPVKAPAGNKSFKLLFEEAIPSNGVTITTKHKELLSRSKNTPASADLFKYRIDRAVSANTLVKEDMDQDLGAKGDYRKTAIVATAAAFASRPLPEKDDIFSGSDALPYDNLQKPVTQRHQSEIEARKSTKRPLSDFEDNAVVGLSGTQVAIPAVSNLLLPSPPPVDLFSRNLKGKGKAAVVGSRKKAKVQEEEYDGDDDHPDEARVKLIIQNGYQRITTSEDDPDPILGYDLHRGSRETVNQDVDTSASKSKSHSHTNHIPKAEIGKFEVDLPDKFRRVLAISPSSKSHELYTERVVRGLLSGRRATHYDPTKGGEIWDVGEQEVDVQGNGTEGEDDWEGEGIPWEVGEL